MAEYYLNRGNEDRWVFPLYDEAGNPIDFSTLTNPKNIRIDLYLNGKNQGYWQKNTVGSLGGIYQGTNSNECFVLPTSEQSASWPVGEMSVKVTLKLIDTLTPSPNFTPTRDFVQWKALGFLLDFNRS